MSLSTENILLVGSILLFISLFAGKTTYKFGIPVLILFLTIGMLAGSEAIGGIHFNNPRTAQFIGIIALNFILFSGGMDTDWQSVRPIIWRGITLSTLGVIITAGAVGVFVWAVTDFTLFEGLLLGSIVSSTDSAAVFSILRSRKLALKGNLRPTLELESGSNDPMAYVLTIAFTGLVTNPESGLGNIAVLFLKQLIFGAILGLAFGRIAKYIINKISLDYEGMYIVLAIAIMFFSFAATDFVGGNGFLAVYLCALYLGKEDLIHKKKLLKSFDSFAWLMQIVLFLTLGLLVFPSQIVPVIGVGLVISLFLIVIARPLSVFLSLHLFRDHNRNKLLISWVGLRGAVPIVFATYPLLAGAEKSHMIFNIVFFISVTSVIIQGTTLSFVARLLHLTLPDKVKHRTLADIELSGSIKSILAEIEITEDCGIAGKQLIQLGLPKTTEIAIIKRKDKFLTPSGSTVIEPGDVLTVLAEREDSLKKVFECLNVKRGESKPNQGFNIVNKL